MYYCRFEYLSVLYWFWKICKVAQNIVFYKPIRTWVVSIWNLSELKTHCTIRNTKITFIVLILSSLVISYFLVCSLIFTFSISFIPICFFCSFAFVFFLWVFLYLSILVRIFLFGSFSFVFSYYPIFRSNSFVIVRSICLLISLIQFSVSFAVSYYLYFVRVFPLRAFPSLSSLVLASCCDST